MTDDDDTDGVPDTDPNHIDPGLETQVWMARSVLEDVEEDSDGDE